MAGISHLTELYTKKGKDFIENLFSNELIVTEKADGSAFLFQRDEEGNKFFKRDDRQPISKLDRTLMRFYEKPIDYITKVSENKKFPTDYRFGFEYFQNTNPVSIVYDRLPKNNLVLTHIKKMDKNGKLVSIIDDEKELKKWAKIFEVEEIYVIFEGKLNSKQKQDIVEFLETPFDNLVKKFETTSFTRYIISILNPSLKNTALSYGIENPIEGLIFKFKNTEFLSKLVDPVFTNAAKIKAKERIERTDGNDQYAILMNSFISWFEDANRIKEITIVGDDEEERYIDTIFKLTTNYIYQNSIFLKDIEIEVPEFAKQEDFRLNKQMIKNTDILKFIKSNEQYEPIYRIFLSGFKQLRVRKTNLIDDNLKNRINKIVVQLNNTSKSINEGFLSFNEWRKNK
jgi:hypothetical protein